MANRGIFFLHGIGWLIFLIFPFFLLPTALFQNADLQKLMIVRVLSSLPLIALFYANLYQFMPALLLHHNWIRFVGLLLGSFVLLTVFNSGVFHLFPIETIPFQEAESKRSALMPFQDAEDRPHPSFLLSHPNSYLSLPAPMLLGVMLSFSLVIVVSSLLALLTERTRIRLENQQAVVEKVSAELSMLKLQISPHFLFNTLNNISWLARKRSPKTEEAVVQLSQLLRYILYQTDKGPVTLRQEVEQLRHYISLQTMRLGPNTRVEFACTGTADYQTVEPLLFIPFVENAFKHGVHSQAASLIRIQLDLTDKRLCFQVENPIFPGPMAALTDSGIGIQNTRRRLALHYPGRHLLRIDQQEGQFCVDLQILLSE